MDAINYDVLEDAPNSVEIAINLPMLLTWRSDVSRSIIFDLRDQRVYEVQLFDDKCEKPNIVWSILIIKNLILLNVKKSNWSRFYIWQLQVYWSESEDDFLKKLTAVVNAVIMMIVLPFHSIFQMKNCSRWWNLHTKWHDF